MLWLKPCISIHCVVWFTVICFVEALLNSPDYLGPDVPLPYIFAFVVIGIYNFITTISFILHLTAPLLLVDEDDDTEHNNLSNDSQEWPQCCKFVCNRRKHNNSTIILEIFSTNDQIAASRSVQKKTRRFRSNSIQLVSFLWIIGVDILLFNYLQFYIM